MCARLKMDGMNFYKKNVHTIFFKNILIICLWVNAKWICFISKILYHKFKDLNRNVDIFLYNCSFKEI